MCYHKAQTKSIDYLADYYSASYSNVMAEIYGPHFHENAFDFLPSPIVISENPMELLPYNWGLIPWWTKGIDAGLKLRVQTLNCISEEMYDKPSFRDSATEGKRCLIPCTGFYEWRWLDEKGKSKVPYYVSVQDQSMFSIAGLYSSYTDKATDQKYYTYTVLTTKANSLMEKIHNSKKRMPVIIPRQYEKDWLSPVLTKEDVLALCQPLPSELMGGYTISKLITNKNEESDVPKVMEPQVYEEVQVLDGGGAGVGNGIIPTPSEGGGGHSKGIIEKPKSKRLRPKSKDEGQTNLF